MINCVLLSLVWKWKRINKLFMLKTLKKLLKCFDEKLIFKLYKVLLFFKRTVYMIELLLVIVIIPGLSVWSDLDNVGKIDWLGGMTFHFCPHGIWDILKMLKPR